MRNTTELLFFIAAFCFHTTSYAQPINISVISANILCKGEITGSIDITVSGGTSPYNFSWSNSAITEDISNLSAGIYSLTVTDVNLQTNSSTVTLTEPAEILMAAIDHTLSQDTVCYGFSTGTVVVVAQGGTSPYSYSWNTLPPKFVSQATGLAAGTYTVTVTDLAGCSASATVTIYNNPQFDVHIIPSALVVCYKDSATVFASTTGGTSPYSYSWNTAETSSSIWVRGDRTYQIYATDRFGCKDDTTIVVGENDSIQVSVTIPSTVCYGYPTQLTATVNGGSGVFTYSWKRGGIFLLGNSNILTAYAGIYQLIVIDTVGGKGQCISSSQFIPVTEFPKLVLDMNATNPTCNSCCDGKIASVVTGGAGMPFTYRWTTVENTANVIGQNSEISGLCEGAYLFKMTDGAGCSVLDTVVLDFPGDIYDELSKNKLMSAKPNPFNNFISLTFSVNGSLKPIRCKILNYSGQIVKDISSQKNENQNILLLETGEIKPGLYFLEVETGEGKGFYKILKIK